MFAASNFGLGCCTATFVARMDADDLARPDRLARLAAYLAAHPDALADGGMARHIGPAGDGLGSKTGFPCPGGTDPARMPAIEPIPCTPPRRPAATPWPGSAATGP